MLNANTPIFCRRNDSAYPDYHYRTFSFAVDTSGEYIMATRSGIDTYGLLYVSRFTPTNPNQNLLAEDDESSGDGQFAIKADLQPGIIYMIVVTTYFANDIGPFTLTFYGNGSILFI